MKKIALISDIHSNHNAFTAVINDALSKGVEGFIFLGDYVTDFPDARETLDLLYKIKEEFPCFIIRGNRERYLLEAQRGEIELAKGTRTGSWLYNYNRLNESDLAYFASLPISDELEIEGIKCEITHSGRDNDRIFFEPGDETIEKIFAEMKTNYLFTGHSHKQYIARSNGKTIINPGSVGLPRGSACKAQYAIIRVENQTISAELLQIGYDIKAAIRRHFESGFVDCARFWALSALHDAVTGVEYTARLLHYANRLTNGNALSTDDEAIWEESANAIGLKFSEEEIISLASKYI